MRTTLNSKHPLSLAIFYFLLSLFTVSSAQAATPWSGIIDPSRAIDWSQAEFPEAFRIARFNVVPRLPHYSGSAAAINSAIAACPAGEFVSLGAGTFSLSSGIDFTGTNNVTLRGQGPIKHFLIFRELPTQRRSVMVLWVSLYGRQQQ